MQPKSLSKKFKKSRKKSKSRKDNSILLLKQQNLLSKLGNVLDSLKK